MLTSIVSSCFPSPCPPLSWAPPLCSQPCVVLTRPGLRSSTTSISKRLAPVTSVLMEPKVAETVAPEPTEAEAEQQPQQQQEQQQHTSSPVPVGGDPWEDAKWAGYKWTVYRGVAYDLTSFIDRHPAGNWLINLAIGRDCTALFESYHLRPEVAVGHLKRLPVLEDFPVDAVPR